MYVHLFANSIRNNPWINICGHAPKSPNTCLFQYFFLTQRYSICENSVTKRMEDCKFKIIYQVHQRPFNL